MKDRKKDPLSPARPVLAREPAPRPQSFTRMEIDTGSAQARRGLDCARRVLGVAAPGRQRAEQQAKLSPLNEGAFLKP